MSPNNMQVQWSPMTSLFMVVSIIGAPGVNCQLLTPKYIGSVISVINYRFDDADYDDDNDGDDNNLMIMTMHDGDVR